MRAVAVEEKAALAFSPHACTVYAGTAGLRDAQIATWSGSLTRFKV